MLQPGPSLDWTGRVLRVAGQITNVKNRSQLQNGDIACLHFAANNVSKQYFCYFKVLFLLPQVFI